MTNYHHAMDMRKTLYKAKQKIACILVLSAIRDCCSFRTKHRRNK